MRVGIDCRTILNPDGGEVAGVGHYTYYLVKNLLKIDRQTEYVLFFDYRMKREGTQEYQQDKVKIRYFPFSSYRKFLPFAYSHMLTAAALLKERLDLFHSPATTMPLTYPKSVVATVHDLAIYTNPDWFPSQVFARRFLLPQTLKRAKRLIAVSHSTKRDLHNLFNVSSRKITVVHEGVATEKLDLKDKNVDVRRKFGLPEQYLLYVGTLEARKNLPTLVEAYADLRQTKPGLIANLPLVLAGAVGYKGEDVIEKIRGMGLTKDVRYVGYVTHNEKINLLSRATLFVFPSLYEGFGLSILEAMNLGCPVVTSNVASMPEIASDAAVLVDPSNVRAIAAGIERVLADTKLRSALRQQGLRRAKEFSWQATARETLGVYKTVLREKIVAEAKREIARSRRKK